MYLMKIHGSFRSYINPLYLHETGPKSCTFTYLVFAVRESHYMDRSKNDVLSSSQKMSQENRIVRFHSLEETFYNQFDKRTACSDQLM